MLSGQHWNKSGEEVFGRDGVVMSKDTVVSVKTLLVTIEGRLPRSGPLQPMLTGNILGRFHVDTTGPHPQTPRGSKYILTCVDSFSKWAETFALPNREAKTIARVSVEQVFCRLRTPISLLTDNAGELDGHLMKEICQLLEIDKQRTSFYRPETNSVAERFHATLNSMMGRMISEN